MPIRWTFITASKSLSSILPKLLSRRMPALAISTSMRPHLSMACLTRCATPASSLTDAPLAMAAPPAALISATTFSAGRRIAAAAVQRSAQVVDHHLGASACQKQGMGPAQPAAGAGDDATLPSKEMVMAGLLFAGAAVTMAWGCSAGQGGGRNGCAIVAATGSSMNCASNPPHSSANQHQTERLQPPDQRGKGHAQHDRVRRRIKPLFEKADRQQPGGLAHIDGIGPFAQKLGQARLQAPARRSRGRRPARRPAPSAAAR